MMSEDDYVRSVLDRYDLPSGEASPAELAVVELTKPITEWAGKYLLGIHHCGSYAKGTRVKGGTDIDLLISLGPRTPLDADKLYDRFFVFMRDRGYKPIRKNVSLGLQLRGLQIDLIPARQEWGGSNDHRIFETEHRRVTRTNFDTHLTVVAGSGVVEEIRLMKIWRTLRNLRMSSFCLELAVMDALRNRPRGQPAANMEAVLVYFRETLPGAPIRDPANFENRVSDDLLRHEKIAIADAATASLREADWVRVVW